VPETLQLRPIQADFKDTLRGALAQRPAAEEAIGDAVARGVDSVFFVGAGGSLTATYPAHFALETAGRFPVFQLSSDEFNHRRPALLSERSLVITESHTGRTRETLEAARLAKDAGAYTVGISRTPDSELAKIVDAAFAYHSEHTVTAAEHVLLGQLAYALLEYTGVPGDYTGIRAAFDALPDAMHTALEEADAQCADIATALKDEPVTYVLGAGPNYGAAYCFAMCYLQEMQWKHAAAFNAGEFFHGAFEVVTEDVPVILLLGEDATRPMAERARTFLTTYTKKAHLIDSRGLTLPGVPDELRPVVTPFALDAILARLAEHYEAVRQHHLDQRRYMFKVEY
jgi:fructoselysine 6-phosphate deglycase